MAVRKRDRHADRVAGVNERLRRAPHLVRAIDTSLPPLPAISIERVDEWREPSRVIDVVGDARKVLGG